jgi:Ca2+-binding EF-hand superfamily protein
VTGLDPPPFSAIMSLERQLEGTMRLLTNFYWIVFIAAAVSSVSLLSTSHAMHELFKSMDKNVDGTINREEFSKDMEHYAFNELDRNKNKSISSEEWMGIEGVSDMREHENLFRKIDKNRDKIITFFEFSDYAENNSNIQKAFIGLDKDGSNTLSPEEISVRPMFRMVTIKFK